MERPTQILQHRWSGHDRCVHGVLWGLKEGHLTQTGRSREGFLEKEDYLRGQVGIKRQRRGMYTGWRAVDLRDGRDKMA